MDTRIVVTLFGTAAVAVAAYAIGSLPRAHDRPPPALAPVATAAPITSPATAPPPVTPPLLAPRLPATAQAAIQRDLPRLHDERDLGQYLDELEARAQRNHVVSVAEVEPGLRAIDQRLPPAERFARKVAFRQRMAALSRTLDGRPELARRTPLAPPSTH